jgi:hypothetical protein
LEFQQNGFFKTDIQTLSSIRAKMDGNDQTPTDGFKYGLDGSTAGKFEEFLNYNQMEKENQMLLNALFSKKNLDADLSVGFKGNPNMGSIVLNQFSTEVDFKDFASCVTANDRIFIISSIFGGTGAAGFPLLVKNIREGNKDVPNHTLLRDTPVGAVTVMPYFNVLSGSSCVIDSNTFYSKTKAALDYYQQHLISNKALNTLYYIGDKTAGQVSPQEGGQNQANNAHYVELLAATAILDFAKIETLTCTEGKANNAVYKEYGLVTGEAPANSKLTFKNLGRITREKIAQPLIQYTYMVNFLENHLRQAIANQQAFTVNRIDKGFLDSSEFYNEDLRVFNNHYKRWLEELSLSNRSFQPMVWNTNLLHTLVNGITQKSFGMICAKPDWSYVQFNDALNRADVKTAQMSKEQLFMAVFYKATKFLYEQRIAPQMEH